MSDLVCITYDKMDTADNVLTELQKLEVEHLTDLEDACVLVRDDKRKEHLKQAVNLVGMGTASGATWGGRSQRVRGRVRSRVEVWRNDGRV